MTETLQTILFWSTVVALAGVALLALIAFVAIARRSTPPDARAVALYYLATCFWLMAWFAGGVLGGAWSLVAILMVLDARATARKSKP